MRFGHGPILVQIKLQHSQVQPYIICTCIIYLTQTHLFGAPHREAVSTIFKVFDMTWPRLD